MLLLSQAQGSLLEGCYQLLALVDQDLACASQKAMLGQVRAKARARELDNVIWKILGKSSSELQVKVPKT